MKIKLYIVTVIFILFYVFESYSQEAYSSSVSGAVPPSAAVMSYAKFANVPVDLSTGTTAVDIPIASLSDGPLSHNVSLSYHTGGIRVSELAGDIGLGWHLNAGGIISREVRGMPDDHEDGYLNTGRFLDVTVQSHYKAVGDGLRDGEPDLFTYSVAGKTGKFMFDEFGVVNHIPASDVKIEEEYYPNTQRIRSFTLTFTDGTKAHLGDVLDVNTGGEEIATTYRHIGGSASHIESWHLKRIESFDAMHKIDFSYKRNWYRYKAIQDCITVAATTNNSPEIEHECDYDMIDIKVTTVYLDKILTSTQEVDFIVFDRLDLLYYNTNADNSPSKYAYDYVDVKNGSFCVRYDFIQDYYYDSTPTISRLQLLEIEKLSCEEESTVSEPSHKFDYYGFTNVLIEKPIFPKTNSFSIDHWGFYNGKPNESLIPYSTEYNDQGSTISHGTADRDSDFFYMKYGALKRVTYPTGGYTEFTYEANEYPSPGTTITSLFNQITTCSSLHTTSCCGNKENTTTVSLSQEMIDNGELELRYNRPTSSTCTNIEYKYVGVSIFDVTANRAIGSTGFNPTNNSGSSFTMYIDLTDLELYNDFIAGNTYEFEVESWNAKGTLLGTYRPDYENKEIGGLRLKKILTNDGISSTLESIIRTFEYNDVEDSDKSSGILFNEPDYAIKPSNVADDIIIFSSNSTSVMSNAEGYHMNYSHAEEKHNGNGKIEYFFNTEDYESNHFSSYPAKPAYYLAKNGILEQSEVRKEGNNALVKRNNVEFNDGDDPNYSLISGTIFACHKIPYNNLYLRTQYYPRTTVYRPTKTTNKLDLVTTESNIFYHPHDKILSPVKTEMTNSDGRVHKSETQYTVDYAEDSGIKVTMEAKHMIGIPYETRKYVNGNLLEGSRTQFAMFDDDGVKTDNTSISFHPRPYQLWTYDRTWDGTTLEDGDWFKKHEYYSYNTSGLPFIEKTTDWEYTYKYYNSDKLLVQSKYSDHSVYMSYYDNSSLLKDNTQIDGNKESYIYDELMRLKTVNNTAIDNSIENGCNDSATHYTYNFTNDITTEMNSIEILQDYEVKTNSAIDDIKTIIYKDGLGRTIQTVGVNQSGWNKSYDNLSSVGFDKHGRIKYSYRLRSSAKNNNGAYTPPVSSWHKTVTDYYSSPLNRVYRTKPQNFSYTYYYYGRNVKDDGVKKNGGNTTYGTNLLYETKVRDGNNNNRTITYKDRLGRTILKRQTDLTETEDSRLDTYTVYDDKSRPTHVLPPGANNTNWNYFRNIFYKYQYDGENKLIEKSIPLAGITTYKYNDKDLLAGYQDELLKANNQWYTYVYDAYGRETKQGMFNGTPTSNFNPHDNHILTTYGVNSYDKDKVTSIQTKILGQSGTPLVSTMTYNDCGTLVSTTGNNHIDQNAGSITTDYIYDGAFNVTNSNSTVSAYGPDRTVSSTQTYDYSGRHKLSKFKVNTGPVMTLSSRTYNAEDELIRLYQGKYGARQYLQKQDFYYKNHGPLSRINQKDLYGSQQAATVCSYPEPANAGNDYAKKDLFYLELFYNTTIPGTNVTKQSNNNIANAKWQVRGREPGMYAYDYDIYNRLKAARYFDEFGTTVSSTDRYSTSYEYDERGNFSHITREGMYDSGGCLSQGVIDDLEFTTAIRSNKLSNVVDGAPPSSVGAGFKNGYAQGYIYDANGNLIKHRDRKITMEYNHLNLPKYINFSANNDRITFTYDAAGNLLKKESYDKSANTTDTRDYVAGIEYYNGVIESIMHEQGRVYYTNGANPRYEYTISDHLGNARVMYSDLNSDGQIESSEEILWEGHYYPFGMEMNGPWMDKPEKEINYKFNGIEKVDNFGLDINMATFRTLDPAIGRWWSVDPKAEHDMATSTYASMYNNPISFTDPEGDCPVCLIPLIAAGIGGTINLGSQFLKGNVTNFWQGVEYFGVGAASGALAVTNPVAAGALNVTGNKVVQIANGQWKPSDIEDGWDVAGLALDLTTDAFAPAGAANLGTKFGYNLAGFDLATRVGNVGIFSRLSNPYLAGTVEEVTKVAVGTPLFNSLSLAGKTSLGSLKNISGSLDDAARLARNQPYGANTNIFRRIPKTAQDVQALKGAQSGLGRNLKIKLGDPRYQGWEKWHYSFGPKGGKSVVHYLRNPKTGFLTDFKFK